MFDNSKPNVVLLTDFTSTVLTQRPLGAHKVAHELRSAGFEVLVINYLHLFTLEELVSVLKLAISDKTLFVGVNSVFYLSVENVKQITGECGEWEQGGIQYAPKELGAFIPQGKKHNLFLKDLVKSISPDCKFVLGGPDAQDREYNSDYDFVMLGQADLAVVNLANHLLHKTALPRSRKSIFKFVVIDGDQPGEFNFMNSTMRFYESDIILPGETLPVEMARGCIFNCKFCSYPLNGKKKNDYIKCEDSMFNEFVQNYERFGVTRYFFIDDTFNESKEKIYTIHRISKKLPFKLEYFSMNRLDLLAAHPETVDLLFDSGCRASFFGIETLNADSARFVGKGGNRDVLIKTINDIKKKYGSSVSLHGAFIFGLPKESVSSIKQTMDQLVSGKTGLDSWLAEPLYIRNPNGVAFTSDLDRNYNKYGYREVGFDPTTNSIMWESDLTNFEECKTLVNELIFDSIQSGTQSVIGYEAFYIAGLGLNLNSILNRPMKDFNWHLVSVQKKKRFLEYLTLLKQHLTT